MLTPLVRLAPAACLGLALLVSCRPAPAAEAERPRVDAHGDPLPDAALARLGTTRFRTGYASYAVLSPDAKLIALPGYNSLSLLDAATSGLVRHIEIEAGGMRHLFLDRLTFSPDGKWLAAAGVEGGLAVCDAARGELRVWIKGDERTAPRALSFSADGGRLAAASDHGKKRTVEVWDVAEKKQIQQIAMPQDRFVEGAALSPDGKALATWGRRSNWEKKDPGAIQLWDADSGKEQRTLTIDGGHVVAAVFAPDGKRLLVADSGPTLSEWDAATGERRQRFGLGGDAVVLRYSPDGKALAAGTREGELQLWEAATGKRIGRSQGPLGRLVSIAFRERNQVVAVSAHHHALRLWEAPSGRELTPTEGHAAPVTTLAFSRDGKTLLSGGDDGVRVWDVSTRKQVRLVEAGRCYLLSPDRRMLSWRGPNFSDWVVVDLDSGQEGARAPVADVKAAYPVAVAADGSAFAVLDTSGAGKKRGPVVRVREVGTGKVQGTIQADVGDQGAFLALSPDARVLAVADGWRWMGEKSAGAALWDVAGGKEIARLTSEAAVGDMAFSPDGALVAGHCQDGATRLWDAIDGKPVLTLQLEGRRFFQAPLFSPDGRSLAVCSYGSAGEVVKVHLWELASGQVRAEYDVSGHCSALAFSPDGRTLAAGGGDTTVVLWDLTGRTELAGKLRGKPTAEELAGLWADLKGRDARKAHRAIAGLAAAPAEALPLLQKELRPAPGKGLSEKEVEQLLADLDDDSFAVREKASAALKEAGRTLRPALLQALQARPSVEKTRRLRQLLEGLSVVLPSPGEAWPARALEVLERMDAPEARRLLQTLAQGNANAPLTRDAEAALRRLPGDR
jgi:WD40 repeat protein